MLYCACVRIQKKGTGSHDGNNGGHTPKSQYGSTMEHTCGMGKTKSEGSALHSTAGVHESTLMAGGKMGVGGKLHLQASLGAGPVINEAESGVIAGRTLE